MKELAIFGGEPIRTDRIEYGRQWVDEDDIKCVADVLRGPLITCGPKVKEFEEKLAKYCEAKYAVAVSNGTAALHCACIAAGIGPGDEVITTPMTFAASANCAIYCGGTPVFADINPETYNIDPKSIREKISPKTKAIVAVDFTGQVVEAREIRTICDEYGLVFIEDAAHSIGSKYEGKKVGSFADMTCMSFHPVKTITGGEGGAILTNDETLHEKLVLAHSHGITKREDSFECEEPEGIWWYEQQELGFNYRMTDFQAALLISQLGKIERFIARRKEIVSFYNEKLAKVKGIVLQKELPETDNAKHLYVIRLDLSKLKCTRREFFDAMSAEGIQCQVHYIPVYWFPYYNKLGYRKGLCKNAEAVYSTVMSIPLYPKMTNRDMEDVVCAIKKVCAYYEK